MGIAVLQCLYLTDGSDTFPHQTQDSVREAFDSCLNPEKAGFRKTLCILFCHVGFDFRKQPEPVVTIGVPLQQGGRQLLLVVQAQDIIGKITLGAGVPAGQFRQFIRKPVRSFRPVQMSGAAVQPAEATGVPGRPPAAPGTFRHNDIMSFLLRYKDVPFPEVIAEIRQWQSVQILRDSRRIRYLPGA